MYKSDLDVKAGDASSIQVCDVIHTFVDQSEKVDGVQGESFDSVVVTDSPQVEHKPKSSASDLHKELVVPRSHTTVPESQGTPSCQVSIKAKKNKSEKSGSSRKRKSFSAGKGSPSNPNRDSGARSSMEQPSRDQKNGKRRNSFGSTRTGNIDQEPGDSSSSTKLQANNSPRSSPDEQVSDIYIKKQGSPRIQWSMSQAQQRVNGNGTQHVHGFVCCKQWRRGTRHSFRRLTASICYGNCYFFFQRVNFFNF
ncbi:hypothetical protein ACOSP7_011305 [Xanthoceras sorbifolium]